MRSRIWADSGGTAVVRTDDPLHDSASFHFTDLGFSQPLHEVVLCAKTGLKIDLPVLAYLCGNTSMRGYPCSVLSRDEGFVNLEPIHDVIIRK